MKKNILDSILSAVNGKKTAAGVAGMVATAALSGSVDVSSVNDQIVQATVNINDLSNNVGALASAVLAFVGVIHKFKKGVSKFFDKK